jgi:hypothetical protein
MPLHSRAFASSPTISAQGDWGGATLAGVLLASVFFIPSAADYIGGLASHAPGSAVMIAIILLGLLHRLRAERILAICFVLGVFVIAHLFIAALFGPIAYGRAAGSLVLIALLLVAADCFGHYLFTLPDVDIVRATAVLRWLMVGIGTLAALGLEPPGGEDWAKPVFPFTEPSHFALAFAPLLIDVCVRSNGAKRIFWLLIGFAFAYLLENLTLVVAVVAAAAVSLPVSRPLPWLVAVSSTIAILNLDYFAERIDLSGYSSTAGTNLSVLIYVQGWDLVVDSFDKTGGWGVGFQQLGLGYVNSPAAEQIYRLVNIELNQQDGGLLAAKIIAEFGIIGLVVVIAFALLAITSALSLRKVATGARQVHAGHVFALATIVGFVINVFVRGLAYFDGTTLLFAGACFYLASSRRKTVVVGQARAPAIDQQFAPSGSSRP